MYHFEDEDSDPLLRVARQEKIKLEAKRAESLAELEKIGRRIKLCENTIAEFTGSSAKKAGSDEEIIRYLRANASAENPMRTPEIGRGMDVKAQSLARRLKKMATDGKIVGSPESGYYVADRAQAPSV